MSQDIEGVIEKMHTKSGTGKKGAWTKYSAIINGGWVNFGFDNPGYTEGQSIKVRCEENQYGLEVKQHRLSEVQPDKPANTPGNSSSGGGGSYNEGQSWGNAGNVASSLIESLVALDALPITGSTGKAAKAKRYDEVLEIFDKLRVKLFNDALNISRVLDQHADEGAVEDTPPPALPDGETDNDVEPDDFEDDIPF